MPHLRLIGLLATALSATIVAQTGNGGTAIREAAVSGTLLVRADRAAFLDPQGGEANYLLSADGSTLKQLPIAGYFQDRWSPNGLRYASVHGGDIAIMDRNGHARRVPKTSAVWSLSWSPDGSFLVGGDLTPGSDSTGIHMWLIDARKARVVGGLRLGFGGEPQWSPDGRWIGFYRSRQGLFVERPDGTRERRLATEDWIWGLQWAPDSRRILYERRTTKAGSRNSDLVWKTLDGAAPQVVLRDRPLSGWALSPRGDRIAISERGALWVTSANGRASRRIAPRLTVWTSSLAWAPDNRHLAFYSGADVWILDVNGGHPQRITKGWRFGYNNSPLQWLPSPIASFPGKFVGPSVPTDTGIESNEIRTTKNVTQLAADGALAAVAYGYEGEPRSSSRCVELWNRAATRVTVVTVPSYCTVNTRHSRGLGDSGLQSLAVAGDRVGISRFEHFAGMDIYNLFAISTSIPSPYTGSVDGPPCPGAATGDCLDPELDLRGDEDLMVFDVWDCPKPSPLGACEFIPKKNGTLWRIDGTKARQIGSGPGPMTPLSVDDGRILVDRGDDRYVLLDGDGRTLRHYELNRDVVLNARLEGNDLVVLTPIGVEVSDANTGAFLRRWPLPHPDTRLVDLDGGIAVLETPAGVRLLRLTDGKLAAIPFDGAEAEHAQLEPEGLFASYTTTDKDYPGRVHHYSPTEVQAAFA